MIPYLLPSINLSVELHWELRQRLDGFYANSPDYIAFQNMSNQVHCWVHLKDHIESLLAWKRGAPIHVLEVGAGRTGFARFLEDAGLRSSVVFHAQDVTRFNELWLTAEADVTYFGDVGSCGISEKMDVVFSTYVLEHVTDPIPHLEALRKFVCTSACSNGALFLFSPRYDLPGYLCPSAKHLPAGVRARFLATALAARGRCILTGQPQFLIQTDLAAFHRPFFLDADAVHWVSLHDLKAWSTGRFGSFETVPIGAARTLSKDSIIKRFCTVGVKMMEPKSSSL